MAGNTALLGRRALAAFVAAMLLLSVMFLLAESPAQANHEQPDDTYTSAPGDGSNEASFWDDFFDLPDGSCTKLTQSGSTAFEMPAPPAGEEWFALVVKQGSPASNDGGPDNFIYLDPVQGHTYPSAGNQAPGYSHLIVCSVEETTTTTDPEVTTTEPEVTTTEPEVTTTEPEVTTTTVPATTTTIEILDSTLVNESTTTTVEILDSTLVNESTTTIEDEVMGTEVLPFTGADSGMLALLAGALGLLGSLILVATRERSEG